MYISKLRVHKCKQYWQTTPLNSAGLSSAQVDNKLDHQPTDQPSRCFVWGREQPNLFRLHGSRRALIRILRMSYFYVCYCRLFIYSRSPRGLITPTKTTCFLCRDTWPFIVSPRWAHSSERLSLFSTAGAFVLIIWCSVYVCMYVEFSLRHWQ